MGGTARSDRNCTPDGPSFQGGAMGANAGAATAYIYKCLQYVGSLRPKLQIDLQKETEDSRRAR